MFINCMLPCGYNENGICTRGVVTINQHGQCDYLRNPEWRNPAQYKEKINVLNIVKNEDNKG